MYLNEFLDMVPPKIIGGDKYSWQCYGENARYLDMEKNVDIVFDEKTHEIYEIHIRSNDPDGYGCNEIWRHSKFEEAYFDEVKERRDISEDELDDMKSNIKNEIEMIERVKKHYESGSIY